VQTIAFNMNLGNLLCTNYRYEIDLHGPHYYTRRICQQEVLDVCIYYKEVSIHRASPVWFVYWLAIHRARQNLLQFHISLLSLCPQKT